MTLDLASLNQDLDLLESVEKANLRLVAQAMFSFASEAADISENERDGTQDIARTLHERRWTGSARPSFL